MTQTRSKEGDSYLTKKVSLSLSFCVEAISYLGLPHRQKNNQYVETKNTSWVLPPPHTLA